MSSILKQIVVILLLLGSGLVATSLEAGCGVLGCNGLIEELRVDNDDVWVKLDANTSSISDCTMSTTRPGSFLLRQSHTYFKEVFSLLLASHLAGRIVYITASSGSNPCRIRVARLRQ